jgi:hypothetical protein
LIVRRIATFRQAAHLKPVASRSISRRSEAKGSSFRPGYCCGIKLPKPAVPSTRPLEEIERAVKAALEKYAHLLGHN